MAERLHFLFRWQQLGGHFHVDVFAGTQLQAENGARPKLGKLVLDERDWDQFNQLVGVDFGQRPHVEFKQRFESSATGSALRPADPVAGPAGIDPTSSAPTATGTGDVGR